MQNLLRQIFSFVLPLTAAVIIPYLLLRGASLPIIVHPDILSIFGYISGMLLLLVGFSIFVLTVRTFILIGKGTLAPWSPTRHLVVGGVYGYVRNPMISGVFFILLGESLLFTSWRLFIWTMTFVLINHIYFIFVEEPGLVRRFGQEYRLYRVQVPRWIPRRRPWKP